MRNGIKEAIEFLEEDIGYLEYDISEKGYKTKSDTDRIQAYRLAIEALCDMRTNELHRQGTPDWMP